VEKRIKGMEAKLCAFLSTAVDGTEWSSYCFLLERDLVRLRDCPDVMAKKKQLSIGHIFLICFSLYSQK
jgi:hypothetical protein